MVVLVFTIGRGGRVDNLLQTVSLFTSQEDTMTVTETSIDFGGRKYEVVRQVALYILAELQHNSASSGRHAAEEIYNEGKKKYPQLEEAVTLETFKVYISSLSREQDAIITRDIGKQGYYLKGKSDEQILEPLQLTEVGGGEIASAQDLAEVVKRTGERKELEKMLYPFLSTWLMEQGYRTQMTDSVKKLGRWGNPDITGIKVEEGRFGVSDIEIATVEAKFVNLMMSFDTILNFTKSEL